MDPENFKRNKPAKNWKEKKPPYYVGVLGFKYCHAESKADTEGFVPVEYAYPQKFDVVTLSNGTREIPSWWTGGKWGGLRIRMHFKPLKWRRVLQLYENCEE